MGGPVGRAGRIRHACGAAGLLLLLAPRAHAAPCGDLDEDGCDDCALGAQDPAADGPDLDGDGLCDAGDPDQDGDGLDDARDPFPRDRFRCGDTDQDGCPDCADHGMQSLDDDGDDLDGDGLCDLGDPDDDGDGVVDTRDPDPRDGRRCDDLDQDGCDDCSVRGRRFPADDGEDRDGDGICDLGDPDIDGDTVPNELDPRPTDPNVCGDVDGDACDDCTFHGRPRPDDDGGDLDKDGICDPTDPDDDNDGVPDGEDSGPGDRFRCRDLDGDRCDDCGALGVASPANDGPDFDGDGACDLSDEDDDNDGVPDTSDQAPFDRTACRDVDDDGCDDCSVRGQALPKDDGPDGDGDGICDAGDPDLDNDRVLNEDDVDPTDPFRCFDRDEDGCDDCAVQGRSNPRDDGPDHDRDARCDLTDPDDDNDGLTDEEEARLGTDPFRKDTDGDGVPDAEEVAAGTDPLAPPMPIDTRGGDTGPGGDTSPTPSDTGDVAPPGCACGVAGSRPGGVPWVLLALVVALRRQSSRESRRW